MLKSNTPIPSCWDLTAFFCSPLVNTFTIITSAPLLYLPSLQIKPPLRAETRLLSCVVHLSTSWHLLTSVRLLYLPPVWVISLTLPSLQIKPPLPAETWLLSFEVHLLASFRLLLPYHCYTSLLCEWFRLYYHRFKSNHPFLLRLDCFLL